MALGCSEPFAIPFVDLTIAGTGLLSHTALGVRIRRRGQPSVSLGICRVAVIGGSPHQLTLSESSRPGL